MNRLVIYLLPTAMRSLTGNHTMDWLYLLKQKFKNVLFNLLIIGRSFEYLSIFQVVRYHKDEDSEEYARTYYEALNHILLTQYILWSGRLRCTQ